MPLILESIVATKAEDGSFHLVPFGLIEEGGHVVVAPFRPSPTIANLERHPFLSAAAPARRPRPRGLRHRPARLVATVPCERIDGVRLADAYAHAELEVVGVTDDAVRPRFSCRIVHTASHAPFIGYNRAQAAVLEAAILSTRLTMLPREKVVSEMTYLAIAVSKTAGPAEHEAWTWIEDKVRDALALAGPRFLADASSERKETVP